MFVNCLLYVKLLIKNTTKMLWKDIAQRFGLQIAVCQDFVNKHSKDIKSALKGMKREIVEAVNGI